MTSVPVDGFKQLLAALDKLEIQYAVAGSMASSLHGVVRFTRDVDLVVRIGGDSIQPLQEQLHADFYLDVEDAGEAIKRGRAFNVIHIASSYKYDLFPLTDDRYEQIQFGRRRFETSTAFGDEAVEFAVISAEDVILTKLRWYNMGGRASEQQWNDVLGVIALKRSELDYAYLREWAEHLGVERQLDEALAERHESGDR